MTDLRSEDALLAFVKEAAAYFACHPKHGTYGGGPTPGEYLALRWGLGEDCVLVVKLDAFFEPVNFQQAIPSQEVAHG